MGRHVEDVSVFFISTFIRPQIGAGFIPWKPCLSA